MNANLFSIDKAPKALPVWDAIISDLGNPPPERIARALGVGRSTVYRWNADARGPRVACLALFWLTRWGRSLVDTQATNDAILYVSLARAMTTERDQLARQVKQLDREARDLAFTLARLQFDHGSAATAGHSRTDTAPGGSLGLSDPLPTLPAVPLAWPALTSSPAAGGTSGHRGNPAAPPPEARSATRPAPGRMPQLPPSTHRESVPSSPLMPDPCHDDAIMASTDDPAFPLLELRQARPLRGHPESVCDGGPASAWPAAGAPRRALAAGVPPASAAWPDAPTAAFHDAQGTNRGTPAATPAAGLVHRLGHRSQPWARPGTPASAAWPERPTSLGPAPDPAPRAQGAPPGAGVFSAIVNAATRNAPEVNS